MIGVETDKLLVDARAKKDDFNVVRTAGVVDVSTIDFQFSFIDFDAIVKQSEAEPKQLTSTTDYNEEFLGKEASAIVSMALIGVKTHREKWRMLISGNST